jgi:hypothetical protein
MKMNPERVAARREIIRMLAAASVLAIAAPASAAFAIPAAAAPVVPAHPDEALFRLVADLIDWRSQFEPGLRADLSRIARGEPSRRAAWLLSDGYSEECRVRDQAIGATPARTPEGRRLKLLLLAERIMPADGSMPTGSLGLMCSVVRDSLGLWT